MHLYTNVEVTYAKQYIIHRGYHQGWIDDEYWFGAPLYHT